MTAYDPFSYGQVSLGGAKAPPAGSPDDILFAETAPTPRKAPAADTSWELLEADVSTLLPNAPAPAASAVDFGTEILGEESQDGAIPAPMPTAQRPRSAPVPERKTTPRGRAAGAPQGQPVSGPAPRTVGARSPGAPAMAVHGEVSAIDTSRRKPASAHPRMATFGRRPSRLAATLVPTTLFACGGTGAAWLYGMEQNLVMAGVVGALSFVAAAFAWVWLRG
jgi:hypothetical protein